MLPEDEFDTLVTRALRRIPPRFRKHLRNVAIIVEREPSASRPAGLVSGTPAHHAQRGPKLHHARPDHHLPGSARALGAESRGAGADGGGHRVARDRALFRHGRGARAAGREKARRKVIRCYITHRQALVAGSLLDAIARNLAAGVTWIQIREKDLSARALFELVEAARKLPNPHGSKIIVNTRADVAIAAGAAGVHLPSGSPAARFWRRPGFLSRRVMSLRGRRAPSRSRRRRLRRVRSGVSASLENRPVWSREVWKACGVRPRQCGFRCSPWAG